MAHRILVILLALTSCLKASATDDSEQRPPDKSKVQKTLWEANVLRERNPEAPRIANLFFPVTKIPVMLVPRSDGLRPLVEINGLYRRPGWSLFYANGIPLAIAADDGGFKIFAYLNAKINEVSLIAKGPNGEVESERVFVFAPNAQEFRLMSPFDSVVLNIGLSHLNYMQSGEGNFRSVTGLISAQYNKPETESRFGFLSRADLTVLTFDSTPIDRSPQLLQAYINGSYRFFKERDRQLQAHVLLGPSYWTMFSRGSPFGFSNLVALGFGVRLRYATSAKTAWNFEFRYAPIKEPEKLEQRGYDLSLSWSKILPSLHRFETVLGFSDFGYKATIEKEIHSNLFAIKIGYTL